MVASVRKYTTKLSALRWARQLPIKYSEDQITKYLSVERGFLIWTEENGLV